MVYYPSQIDSETNFGKRFGRNRTFPRAAAAVSQIENWKQRLITAERFHPIWCMKDSCRCLKRRWDLCSLTERQKVFFSFVIDSEFCLFLPQRVLSKDGNLLSKTSSGMQSGGEEEQDEEAHTPLPPPMEIIKDPSAQDDKVGGG